MSKIKNSGLDRCDTEPFEQQQFGTADIKGVNKEINNETPFVCPASGPGPLRCRVCSGDSYATAFYLDNIKVRSWAFDSAVCCIVL